MAPSQASLVTACAISSTGPGFTLTPSSSRMCPMLPQKTTQHKCCYHLWGEDGPDLQGSKEDGVPCNESSSNRVPVKVWNRMSFHFLTFQFWKSVESVCCGGSEVCLHFGTKNSKFLIHPGSFDKIITTLISNYKTRISDQPIRLLETPF